MEIVKRRFRRVGVAIIGGLVLLLGVITIPYPGPGWLIVFAGLAILATEFTWARRMLHILKGRYESWREWLSRQAMWVRVLVLVFTGLIVGLTLWLLNLFALADSVLNLHTPWLHSPLGFFSK